MSITYIANKRVCTLKNTGDTPPTAEDAVFTTTERGQQLPEGVYDEATIKAWLKKGIVREQGKPARAIKPVLTSDDPDVVPGKSRKDEEDAPVEDAPKPAAKPAAKPAKTKS